MDIRLCFFKSRITIPHCVLFGVTVHRYVEGRKWNTQGAPDLSPDFGSIPEYLSSYVVLFVFCFSTGKAMLAINKGLQRSVFFSLLPLRFPLLIFVTSSIVWLHSLSLSLSHSLSLSLSLRLVTNSISSIAKWSYHWNNFKIIKVINF